ncbi:DUF3347 domain-containing protein [Flavobacterium xueshanense]|uniref:DUF3347 domain-containing protein n=1 Tax=Flavobacterium xueshanense TaxID=935223 RepID=A0A1I2IV13_9FLAO|nr:Protein of unknown function [Flavobacterium xueshanense]
MKSLKKTVVAITLLLSVVVSNAQIKNAQIETVKIFGNCAMCETTMEKAGSLKKIANIDWNIDTKVATLTYDTKKTNQDEILKRIALAGYDSEKFLAPDAVYSKLAECCQYDRVAKVAVKKDRKGQEPKTEMVGMKMSNDPSLSIKQETNQLKAIFDNYFLLKDALVKTDGESAVASSKELLTAITAVKMETLKMDVHLTWMKVFKDLTADAKNISEI